SPVCVRGSMATSFHSDHGPLPVKLPVTVRINFRGGFQAVYSCWQNPHAPILMDNDPADVTG
ncbi:hypothetical protein ACTUHF_005541, partial [Escherichia coli]